MKTNMENRRLDLYDLALFLAEHLVDEIENNGLPQSPKDIQYSIMNGISKFEELQDEDGNEYRVNVGRLWQ